MGAVWRAPSFVLQGMGHIEVWRRHASQKNTFSDKDNATLGYVLGQLCHCPRNQYEFFHKLPSGDMQGGKSDLVGSLQVFADAPPCATVQGP